MTLLRSEQRLYRSRMRSSLRSVLDNWEHRDPFVQNPTISLQYLSIETSFLSTMKKSTLMSYPLRVFARQFVNDKFTSSYEILLRISTSRAIWRMSLNTWMFPSTLRVSICLYPRTIDPVIVRSDPEVSPYSVTRSTRRRPLANQIQSEKTRAYDPILGRRERIVNLFDVMILASWLSFSR